LLDVFGNFQGGPYIGAPGGQLLQIYYILEQINLKFPNGLRNYMEKKIQNDDEDYFLRPNNPRELLLPEHLMPFFMQYLKDMKNDGIEVFLNKESAKFLKMLDCPFDDLSKLSDEDLISFKEVFQQNRVSPFHQGLGNTMQVLYDYLIDILSKRVPVADVDVKVE